MNLIINVVLSEPPSELYSFRDIVLYSKVFLNLTILADSKQEEKDLYWRWLKKHGCFDYIEAILRLDEKESGISLSYLENRPKRIKTDRITCNNLKPILSKIAAFA